MPANLLNATQIIPRTVAGTKPRNPGTDSYINRGQELVPYSTTFLSANNRTLKINTLNVYSSVYGNILESKRRFLLHTIKVNLLYLENPNATPVLLNSEIIWRDDVKNKEDNPSGTDEGAYSSYRRQPLNGIDSTSLVTQNDPSYKEDEFIIKPRYRDKFTMIDKTDPLYVIDQASMKLELEYLAKVNQSLDPSYVDPSIYRNTQLDTVGFIDLSYICSYEEIQ